MELASVFGLAINSTITRIVAETTNLEITDYSEYLLSTTQASVNVDNLYGVEIVKRVQTKDGSYQSLAVMEKTVTQNRYASLIESDLDEIEAIRNGISHDGSFSTLGKASELVTLSDECNTRIVMYNYLSGENRALLNLSESKEIYRQALRSIVLETEVAGDETGAVESAVNKIFTDAGFAVSNGELAPTAKAKVSINWTRTDGIGNPFIFANYNADVSVMDLKVEPFFRYRLGKRHNPLMVLYLIGQPYDFKSVFHTQFSINGADMVAYCLFCKKELFPYLPIIITHCDHPKYILFPVGQCIKPFKTLFGFLVFGTGAIVKAVNELRNDLRGNLYKPRTDSSNRGDQFSRRNIL